MKQFPKSIILALIISSSFYACGGNAVKNQADSLIKSIKADQAKLDTTLDTVKFDPSMDTSISTGKITHRTFKTNKTATVDPKTGDSIIVEDSIIRIKTVIRNRIKK